MGLEVDRAMKFFFDREKVDKAVDAGRRKALSKFGAYVRQRARSSMRKRKKASAPGSPPSVHEGSLKKLLYFQFEPATKGVVIGPVKFGGRSAALPTTPELHEYGGLAWRDGKLSKYPARPYMRPAFDAVKEQLGPILSDFIEGDTRL